MKLQILSVLLISIFLIIAGYIFLKITPVSNNLKNLSDPKNKLKRLFPAIVSLSILFLVFSVSLYFDYKDDEKRKELDALLKKDSLGKINYYQKAAIDTSNVTINFKNIKQKVDSDYHAVTTLKQYTLSTNTFKKKDPAFRDTVDSTYRAIKRKKAVIDTLQRYLESPLKSGYVYYGIYSNGNWSDQNFKTVGEDENASPKIGDMVKCIVPTNIRQGEIKFVPGKGWVNQLWVGGIKKDQIVKVLDVKFVLSSYIWIKI